MLNYITRFWDLLGVNTDPSIRNSVSLILCIVLYGIFISRDKTPAQRRVRRLSRCPDSILRDA